MPFNMFPYSNFHDLNLDWVLAVIRTMASAIEQASGTISGYEARLAAVEGGLTSVEGIVSTISPKANGAVRYDAQQQLTTPQQTMARGNIGAAPAVGVVMYNTEQTLGDSYKEQARQNIGAAAASDVPDVTDVLRYSAQSLSSGQQQQARENIGALGSGDLPAAVLYTEQSLSNIQKAQARENIGAIDRTDLDSLVSTAEVQNFSTLEKAQARSNIGAAYDVDVSDLSMIATYTFRIDETSADVFAIFSGSSLEEAIYALQHGGAVIVELHSISDGVLRGVASFSSGLDNATMIATLSDKFGPGANSSTGYRIIVSNNDSTDVLSVTKFYYKTLPDCGILDNGKILQVNNAQPTWSNLDSPVEIVYATLNTTTGVCTPGEGFTFSNLHNNQKIVFAYVTAQNNYIYRFILGTDRPTRVVFNNVSIYPSGNDQTKYDMFITIDNNNNVEYIRNTETFTPS